MDMKGKQFTSMLFPVAVCGLLLLAAACTRKPEVSVASLLQEMTDRSALARYPNPAWRAYQASSYDRASVRPDTASWFANWDRSQFLRTDSVDGRREFVLLDADGPGAVVRFWVTVADYGGKGTLRIYLDHAAEPVIEGEVLSLISGGVLAEAPLSASVAEATPYLQRGHNLYLPVPYARHCKITYESPTIVRPGKDSKECFYYNIGYRTYEPGTRVRTFARSELEACRDLQKQVCAQLLEPTEPEGGRTAGCDMKNLADGPQRLALDGAAAISRLSVRLQAENLEQALRSTVLRMTFDGDETVWVPVGDFFGTGNRLKPYSTYFTSVSADTLFTCRWVMPYRDSCSVVLENVRGDRVKASLEVTTVPWRWDDRSMHFGAGWTEYNHLYTGATRDMEGTAAQCDLNFVRLQGKGVYVGDALTLFNSVADWWGEGDEKIYVDNERFPSHFGTGTEDYYGYAWCMHPPFSHPFIAQPDGSGDTQVGHVANVRFRALDAIPFTTSLVFDMEMWHWASTYINYAPTTFWYMMPGGAANRSAEPEQAACKVALHKNDLVPDSPGEQGFIEGEFMETRLTGGVEKSQSLPFMNWSNGAQWFWRDAAVGDTARVAFTVGQAGRYMLDVHCTVAPDYGRCKVLLNGKTLKNRLDLYAERLQTTVWHAGRVQLNAGRNELVFVQLKPDKRSVNNFIGIDGIVLKKQSNK